MGLGKTLAATVIGLSIACGTVDLAVRVVNTIRDSSPVEGAKYSIGNVYNHRGMGSFYEIATLGSAIIASATLAELNRKDRRHN
ncbi:MAG: hypothetical protein WCK90_00070 [archaeon]